MVWSPSTSGRTEHHGHPQCNSAVRPASARTVSGVTAIVSRTHASSDRPVSNAG
jgi:hypothetical protein